MLARDHWWCRVVGWLVACVLGGCAFDAEPTSAALAELDALATVEDPTADRAGDEADVAVCAAPAPVTDESTLARFSLREIEERLGMPLMTEAGTIAPRDLVPVALFNRFDVAPADGSHCGEYRIALSRPNDRALFVFETVLPNPAPACGLEACRPVVEFWSEIANEAPASKPNASVRIEGFYDRGLSGFEPILAPRAQPPRTIRTSCFELSPWSLRELQLLTPAPRPSPSPEPVDPSPEEAHEPCPGPIRGAGVIELESPAG